MEAAEPNPAPPHARARAVLAGLLSGDDRAYLLAFVLASAFSLAPYWAGDILPFQDYAGNMSYAAIVAGAREAGSLFDRTYVTGSIFLPNSLLFYLWGWLAALTGYVVAGKILLSIYAIALPLSVDRLLVATGRSRAFALLAFPLAMNGNMLMGFVGFATALPLAVYTLARAYRFQTRPTLAAGLGVTALSMLTFLGHAQMYLLLGVVAAVFIATAARSLREMVLLAVPFAASLLLFFPWFWHEFIRPEDVSSLGGRPLDPLYPPLSESVQRVAEYAIARWGGAFDDRVFVGMVGIAALGLLDRRGGDRASAARWPYGLELISLALFATYLIIPEHTQVQAAIASRLVPVALVFGLGWLALPRTRVLRAVVVWGMLALAIHFGWGAARAVARFNAREVGPGFLALIEQLPEGSRVAYMTVDRSSDAVTVLPHQHLYGYHFALNGGLSYSGFHGYAGRHATWRHGEEVPWPGRDPRAFLRGDTACWYDYLLLRTAEIPRWRELEPRVTFIGSSARYTLWKLEHDAMSACAPPEAEIARPAAPEETRRARSAARLRSRRPLSATLAPEVGHARGRDINGAWPPADRARYRARAAPPDTDEPSPAAPDEATP
ncbi:MAG: hypothetical protein H6744_04215 [Deltaproteobacteria bacterium]|nr:hypothetical protein [Deltaproteobacteria bacterium]MCB9785883.1 hypothetical protein [Deltaproteobacteria bacterium]